MGQFGHNFVGDKQFMSGRLTPPPLVARLAPTKTARARPRADAGAEVTYFDIDASHTQKLYRTVISRSNVGKCRSIMLSRTEHVGVMLRFLIGFPTGAECD